jgi:hypothetical protein
MSFLYAYPCVGTCYMIYTNDLIVACSCHADIYRQYTNDAKGAYQGNNDPSAVINTPFNCGNDSQTVHPPTLHNVTALTVLETPESFVEAHPRVVPLSRTVYLGEVAVGVAGDVVLTEGLWSRAVAEEAFGAVAVATGEGWERGKDGHGGGEEGKDVIEEHDS